MSSFIQQSIRNGVCVLYHDYRLGHARDLSLYANDGTEVNAPVWNRNGIYIRLFGDQTIRVAHAASISLTTQTVIVLMRWQRLQTLVAGLFGRIAAKDDGVTGAWELYYINANEDIGWNSDGGGAVNWAPARNLDGIFCMGFNMQNGAAPPCYYDGVEAVAAPGGAGSIITGSVPLYIGNAPGLNRGIGGTLSAFLLFNELLTATQHAQIYGELMQGSLGVLV